MQLNCFVAKLIDGDVDLPRAASGFWLLERQVHWSPLCAEISKSHFLVRRGDRSMVMCQFSLTIE